MAVAQQELSWMDKDFTAASEPEVGSPIPDGIYQAKVDSVEVRHSQKGRLGLSQELIIIGGNYDGRKLFKWSNMPETPTNEEEKTKALQSLGFLKKDLRSYGINIDAPGFSLSGFLSGNIGDLLDRVVEVQVKTKKGEDSANIYINKLVSAPGGALSGELLPTNDPNSRDWDPFAEQ